MRSDFSLNSYSKACLPPPCQLSEHVYVSFVFVFVLCCTVKGGEEQRV